MQIYENDRVFLDALSGFVGGGINAGECVIVIATARHLEALEERLSGYGIKVNILIEDERYIPLDAEETLSAFMVEWWPDEALFTQTISSLIQRGAAKKRRIRVFGEMVSMLWAQGYSGATVQLEHLWNQLCEQHELCLFCAYPKTGFTQDMNESIMYICSYHSKMIDGLEKQLTEIVYKNI